MPSPRQESPNHTDGAARRAAKRVGLRATKSRWRRDSYHNLGGFQIVDESQNLVVAGARFDFSADDVVEFCESRRIAEGG